MPAGRFRRKHIYRKIIYSPAHHCLPEENFIIALMHLFAAPVLE